MLHWNTQNQLLSAWCVLSWLYLLNRVYSVHRWNVSKCRNDHSIFIVGNKLIQCKNESGFLWGYLPPFSTPHTHTHTHTNARTQNVHQHSQKKLEEWQHAYFKHAHGQSDWHREWLRVWEKSGARYKAKTPATPPPLRVLWKCSVVYFVKSVSTLRFVAMFYWVPCELNSLALCSSFLLSSLIQSVQTFLPM